jgi:hypothetical protein
MRQKKLADQSRDYDDSVMHKRRMRELIGLVEQCAKIWKEHSRYEKWKSDYSALSFF